MLASRASSASRLRGPVQGGGPLDPSPSPLAHIPLVFWSGRHIHGPDGSGARVMIIGGASCPSWIRWYYFSKGVGEVVCELQTWTRSGDPLPWPRGGGARVAMAAMGPPPATLRHPWHPPLVGAFGRRTREPLSLPPVFLGPRPARPSVPSPWPRGDKARPV